MVVHTYPSTQEVEARGSWVQAHPGLHSETFPVSKHINKKIHKNNNLYKVLYRNLDSSISKKIKTQKYSK
jgi:hypothetical protein